MPTLVEGGASLAIVRSVGILPAQAGSLHYER